MRLFLQLALVVVLTSSCYTAKSLNRTIKKQNLEIVSNNISGSYELEDIRYNENLYEVLKSNTSFDFEKAKINSGAVNIKMIDSTNILISLIMDDIKIDSFELKGEMTEFGFLTQRLKKIYPFLPIFFYIHWERRLLLGIDTDNRLLLSIGYKSEGAVLGFGSGKSYKKINIFKSIR